MLAYLPLCHSRASGNPVFTFSLFFSAFSAVSAVKNPRSAMI
jgi:hypothetical protein